MAVEFPLRPLGASLLHESFRERLGAGGEEEEEGERKREREREDGVLSAKCNLNREERTMGGKKNPTVLSFSLT